MGRSSNYTHDRNYWFISDFETITTKTKYYQDNGDTGVLLFSLQKYESNDTCVNGVNIGEYFTYIMSFKKSCTVFFHNLSFDGDFIVKYLQQHTRFKLTYADKKVGFKFFRQNNRIYYIQLSYKIRNKNGNSQWIKIVFRCSLLLLSASVSALAKSIGKTKYITDDDMSNFYDREPTDTLENVDKRYLDYCNNDVDVVNTCLSNFTKSLESLPLLKAYNDNRLKNKKSIFNPFHYLTAGALAMGLLKNIYLPNYNRDNKSRISLYLDESDYDTIRPFYTGGWTQFNPDFNGAPVKVNNGVFIDVNSAYPHQMSKELPYGVVHSDRPNTPHYTFKTIKVISATIKDKFKNVVILRNWKRDDVQKEMRYVRELNNFICHYIEEEWDIINEYYDIKFEWIENKYMLKQAWAKEYIYDLYYWKSYYKSCGNNAFANTFKILLNSSYGKMGMRKDFDSMYYIPKIELHGDSYSDINQINRGNEILMENKKFNFKYASETYKIDETLVPVICTPVKSATRFSNIASASVITALERVYLWETIRDLGPDKFIYSDTDSIAFRDITDKQLEQYVGDELGKWDIEFRFNEFGCFGVKKYQVLNDGKELKFKFAGLNKVKKDLEYMNFDDDILQIADATLIRKSIKSGIVLIKSDKIFSRGNL